MKMTTKRLWGGVASCGLAVLSLALIAAPLAAQAKKKTNAQKVMLDRTVEPKPSAKSALRVPAWTKSTLANGAQQSLAHRLGLPEVARQADEHRASVRVADQLGHPLRSSVGRAVVHEQQLQVRVTGQREELILAQPRGLVEAGND